MATMYQGDMFVKIIHLLYKEESWNDFSTDY